MAKHILVVSAHPDDETLGCGGTLLKHIAAGDRVDWLIATDGWEPLMSRAWLDEREKQISLVQAAYGLNETFRLGFRAAMLSSTPIGEVVAKVRDVVARSMPDIVYTVFPGDVHDDHRVVFDAVHAAAKPFRGGRDIKALFAYETPSSTNMAPPFSHRAFLPQVFSDITPFLPRKIEIFRIFASEIQAVPGPRSEEAITALARWRGSAVGMDFAESFMTIRQIL